MRECAELLRFNEEHPLPSSHPPPAAELPAQPPSCADAALWVFVGLHPELGSFAMRGQQTAELLERHTRAERSAESTVEAMSCEHACSKEAYARFHAFLAHPCGRRRLLVTHVKYACEVLLEFPPGRLAQTEPEDHRNVFHLFDPVRVLVMLIPSCATRCGYMCETRGVLLLIWIAGGPNSTKHHGSDAR
jgi:hypothetical protein